MTHGVHFLPQVDQIIVIEDGRISEVCSTLHYLSRLPAKSYVEKKSDSTVAKKKKQMKALLFSLSFQRSQRTRAEMRAMQAP